MKSFVRRGMIFGVFIAGWNGLQVWGQVTAGDAAVMPMAHVAYPGGDGTELGQRIDGILADPTVTRAHWGIAVAAMDGTPIWGMETGKLFRPASNAKLYTTAAAMALLGPGKTFETRIYGRMDATGEVKGDLVLVGGGDPSFGSNDLPYQEPGDKTSDAAPKSLGSLSDLAALADQLVAKGVKRVTGDVVGDDTLFPWEPYGESWAVDDLVWGYGAPVSALSIADNEMKLTIPAGTITGPKGRETYQGAVVTLDQSGVPYYTVESQVQVTPAGFKGNGVDVERLAGSRNLRVFGEMPVGSTQDVEHVAIQDPAQYAAMALRQMLVERGIEVSGGARAQHQPLRTAPGFAGDFKSIGACEALTVAGGECAGGCAVATHVGTVLASHTSAPLAEDIVFTDKTSQNLHAEIFLHQLGRRVTCGDGSTESGVRMVRAYLVHAGLDPEDFMFYDGSGLSAKDLVAPRATVQLLSYAAKQPWFAQWKAALPVGGVDGSLSGRFKEDGVRGKVFAKTGTLGESRALSGYVMCASGKELAFSIMVDDHAPVGSGDRAAMDKIVAAIAALE
jgi:D-alanyl-D-alanine carboxypeptidase/D-alanyl-D-alanine-endopeptidase (penicillin-binding protein 4)